MRTTGETYLDKTEYGLCHCNCNDEMGTSCLDQFGVVVVNHVWWGKCEEWRGFLYARNSPLPG